jgi:hypothetical protein
MKTCKDFPIGSRVSYYTKTSWGQVREATGTVVKHYPGYGEVHEDEETGERWVTPDHLSIKVDAIPPWWPYPGTDRFAPGCEDCTLL